MPGRAPRTRILIALASQEAGERLRGVLEGHELVLSTDIEEAKRLLASDRFGMVIIGVHFDDSQMFELLLHARSEAKEVAVPVVCVLTSPGRLSAVMIEGLDRAVKAMMANAFLDLRKFPDDEHGNTRLRRIVDYLILIDGDLHQGLERAEEV